MADKFQPATLTDSIGILVGGCNSGMLPLLIEKTQASYLNNITVRDGFASPRPPYSKTHLTMVWPSPLIQAEVEQGLFQGAMPTPYRSDSGETSQIAAISGKLYKFLTVGNVVTVSDISIPGDPNPATATQAWLWQAENFVIVNDGISLPIFYDGNTSRRSYGPTQVLGAVIAAAVIIPPFGESVLANVSSYTGPMNVPVLIGGFYYQVSPASGAFLVDAVRLYDTAATIPLGTQLVINPSIAGVIENNTPLAGSFAPGTPIQIQLTSPYTGAIGATVILFGKIWTITGTLPGDQIVVMPTQTGTYSNLLAGTKILFAGSSSPSVVAGTTQTTVPTPAPGGTVQLVLNNVFTGTPGQVVYIGATGQYQITAVTATPPAPGTLTLININATNNGILTIPLTDIISVPELPAGRMGAYGHGQNWVSLVDGQSFIPSDFSGGPSGTPAYQYRDAVLKTTLLTFRSGNFRIPSSGDTITSMTFAATLDESMGQGHLMIGTARSIFSCRAPLDPSDLPTILLSRSPILSEALKGRGPLAQNSTINVNSDIQFRSIIGLGSLILARQQFTQSLSGNTPISEEMTRVFNKDNQQLLPYSSAINFDNRVLFTASPNASSQGVFHTSLVAMNLDGLSSLRGKEPACYDGQWTGLNVLQLTQGLFNGTSRAFAFTFNVTLSKIELYELMPTGDDHFDNGTTPITAIIETASLFNVDVKPHEVFLQLLNGEIAVDQIIGTVRFQVFYKPDQYGAYGEESCWVPWHAFPICAAAGSKPLYFPRLGFVEPESATCNDSIDAPTRFGRTFQVRLIISGMWRMLNLRVAAVTQPVPQFQRPICDEVETVTV